VRLRALRSGSSAYTQFRTSREYEVVLIPEQTGGYSVTVPALPGCVSQGETREEALAMIREAIEGYLESLQVQGDPIPGPVEIERVTVLA
jgi:predicted RNase H-like HicB family nuclease